MSNPRCPTLLNVGVAAGAVVLAAACTPKEAPPATPATNRPPENAVTVTGSEAKPVITNPAAADLLFTPEEAKHHVGEIATVRGKVFEVHVSQKGDVFINLGAKRPSPFTAVCFQQAIPTDQLTALNGKTISVRGKIKDFNGQIEIILENEHQILK